MTHALVLNVGSSTLKWTVFRCADRRRVAGSTAAWRADRLEQVRGVLASLPRLQGIGHRVVHGGLVFTAPAWIDPGVRARLEALRALDPLHMDPALQVIDAALLAHPGVPQLAAFDTTFHATLPPPAACYALPHEWTERWGLRRYGFHGLSLESVLAQLAAQGPLPPRMVICHLGSGCSVTAVHEGRSVDTTMGFSPLEGPMMATRAGSVDPGLLLHLQIAHGLDAQRLHGVLSQDSGLLGMSGVSADLREVTAAAREGHARAALAVERFVLDLRRAIGAMAGVLGGVDALVFTGGIGEHNAGIRARAAAALAGLGLAIDAATNETALPGRDLSAPGSKVRVLAVASHEDEAILAHLLRTLHAP